eukprot:Hpha_TRINITY_DN4903_c0_g1::TRINITY_DN4903_c0_g1_i1::g.51330::m.51330
MFASRAAMGVARRAARQIAFSGGALTNGGVQGGIYCQNCFALPSQVRMNSSIATAMQAQCDESEDPLWKEDAVLMQLLPDEVAITTPLVSQTVAQIMVGNSVA